MPMSEDLLKVRLSLAEGQPFGTFTEGMPVAEALELIVGFQIDDKTGGRHRRFGRVSGVEDELLNIDNQGKSSEQVVRTTVHFTGGPPLVITWSEVAVAMAEVANMMEENQ